MSLFDSVGDIVEEEYISPDLSELKDESISILQNKEILLDDILIEKTIEYVVNEHVPEIEDGQNYIACGIDIGAQNMGIVIIEGRKINKNKKLASMKFNIIRFIHYRPNIDKKMKLGDRVNVLVKLYDDVFNGITPHYIGIETQFVSSKNINAVNFLAKDLASMTFGILQERFRKTKVISIRPTLNSNVFTEGRSHKTHDQRKNDQWHCVMDLLKKDHLDTYNVARTMMESSHPCDALLLALMTLRC